jgi:hypothetical protein
MLDTAWEWFQKNAEENNKKNYDNEPKIMIKKYKIKCPLPMGTAHD